MNPGTPIYAVKGYSPEFRLAALEDGTPRLFEADTHPKAERGEALLDIRGKVAAIDILSAKDARTVLEVWPESHWPGFALRQADVFIVLYGMVVYAIRFNNQLLHRQSTLGKRRLGENRGFRPSF